MATEHEPAGDGAERSPEEIEREIAGTRAALESTVDELGERLRPGQMAEEARSYVREKAADSASEAWRSVRDTVRSNPIPVACVLGGVAALLAIRQGANGSAARSAWGPHARTRRRHRDRFLEGPRPAGLSSWLASAGERAGEAGAHAAERALELSTRLRDSDAASHAQHQVERTRSELETAMKEQPLLLGIASFAAGAVLGGALRSRG